MVAGWVVGGGGRDICEVKGPPTHPSHIFQQSMTLILTGTNKTNLLIVERCRGNNFFLLNYGTHFFVLLVGVKLLVGDAYLPASWACPYCCVRSQRNLFFFGRRVHGNRRRREVRFTTWPERKKIKRPRSGVQEDQSCWEHPKMGKSIGWVLRRYTSHTDNGN